MLERRRRYFKRWTTPMTIHHVRLFPDAVALDLVKPPEFVFVPGMFVYLNVPMLGRHEWHPFSISSAPSDPHLSFRIQAAGDWTSALLKHLTTYALHDNDDETWPQTLRDLDAHGDSHLDTRLYVTQPNNSLEQAAHHHQFRNERPQWSHILDELEQKHPGITVGMFYCGPQALQKELQHLCHFRSANPCNSTKFQFYAESNY
ncbi:hypothetical protein DYB25_007618 [Aphanomyces astaci]|uniref:FAD-binding FR-type domain-containing protein n=1 Tax=Aphanomyces astaci TaxID=112090 RepID=A0A397BW96_APHAT|nr:hypothetical protein DYB25_007618 [Aphanomyces astaci]